MWCRSGVFIVNFEHISHLVPVFFFVNFEHVIAVWDGRGRLRVKSLLEDRPGLELTFLHDSQ